MGSSLVRGFGATLGVGATDVLNPPVVPSNNAVQTQGCWVYHRALEAAAPRLMQVLPTTSGSFWRTLVFETTGELSFIYDWDLNTGQWTTLATVSLGVWHAIVAIYDNSAAGNNPTIYLDGVSMPLTQTSVPSGTARTPSGLWHIGNNTAFNRCLDGMMARIIHDENHAWTAQQVADYSHYGRPWGSVSGVDNATAVERWVPLETASLTNLGTVGGTCTVTGTVVQDAQLPQLRQIQQPLRPAIFSPGFGR